MKHPIMKHPIINQPHLLDVFHKLRDQSIGAAMWGTCIAVFLPAFSLIAWACLGSSLIDALQFKNLLGLKPWPPEQWIFQLQHYAGLIMLACTLIGTWSWLNKRQARKVVKPAQITLSLDLLAHAFGVDANALKRWQQQKNVLIHHSHTGAISDVVCAS